MLQLLASFELTTVCPEFCFDSFLVPTVKKLTVYLSFLVDVGRISVCIEVLSLELQSTFCFSNVSLWLSPLLVFCALAEMFFTLSSLAVQEANLLVQAEDLVAGTVLGAAAAALEGLTGLDRLGAALDGLAEAGLYTTDLAAVLEDLADAEYLFRGL